MRTRHLISTLLILIGAAGFMATGWLWNREQFTVYADEAVITVTGRYAQVSDVLEAAGVAVGTADIVRPALTNVADPDAAIEVQRASTVVLRTERGEAQLYTHQITLGGFLAEQGLLVGRTDQLFADTQPVPFNAVNQVPLPNVVEIGNFVTVTIFDGNVPIILRTNATTVGGALTESGVVLYAADNVTPSPGIWLTDDTIVKIERSIPLTIVVDGGTLPTRSHEATVQEVLAEAGIGLVGADYTRPPLDAIVQENGIIEVVRVTEDFRVIDTPIPFDTVWQGTGELELDQRGLLQAGQPGVNRQRVRLRFENGLEVSQEVDGEWIAQAPVDEIMGYGTRIELRTINTPSGPQQYYRKVRMRVTAYTASSSGKAPDHPAYGITRSGLPAGTGIVAVDPRVVPFLSNVYVPGYGVGLAGDTGGGVLGRWIDLGYDEDEYVSWSGYVDVYFLAPVPETINYLIPTWLP